jgi:hypothetical protein
MKRSSEETTTTTTPLQSSSSSSSNSHLEDKMKHISCHIGVKVRGIKALLKERADLKRKEKTEMIIWKLQCRKRLLEFMIKEKMEIEPGSEKWKLELRHPLKTRRKHFQKRIKRGYSIAKCLERVNQRLKKYGQ